MRLQHSDMYCTAWPHIPWNNARCKVLYSCMYVCVCVYVHIYICILHIYMCTYVFVYVYMYLFIQICTYTHRYTLTHWIACKMKVMFDVPGPFCTFFLIKVNWHSYEYKWLSALCWASHSSPPPSCGIRTRFVPCNKWQLSSGAE